MTPRPRYRWLAGAFSLAAHLGAFALVMSSVRPLSPGPPAPVFVQLVQAPRPDQPQKAPPKAKAKAQPAPPRPALAAAPRRTVRPAPSDVEPIPAADVPGEGLSEAQLAGAAAAGEGPPGGACDMARRIQTALRRDPLVRTEVAARGAGALMVWNGDWVQSQGEDGKGLAAVREAIIWEVAFAPPACRAEPVRGLILLTLNSSARLALGLDQWRWSDLLRVR